MRLSQFSGNWKVEGRTRSRGDTVDALCQHPLGEESVWHKRHDGLSEARQVGRVYPNGTSQQHREGKWQRLNAREGQDSIREKRLRKLGEKAASVTSDGVFRCRLCNCCRMLRHEANRFATVSKHDSSFCSRNRTGQRILETVLFSPIEDWQLSEQVCS